MNKQNHFKSKTHKDEDFIVLAPFFSQKEKKKIKDFYNIARKADDVADSPTLSVGEKLTALEDMKKDLKNKHLLTLFQAFELDAKEQVRINTYEDLLDYCKLSACPVADFLIDLFQEDYDKISGFTHDLAISFQILNHIKDYKTDLTVNNRSYLPKEWLDSFDVSTVIEHLIVRVSEMLINASRSSYYIKSNRLKLMVELCLAYGFAHIKKLKKSLHKIDKKNLRLSKMDKFQAICQGLYHYFRSIKTYSRDERVIIRICKTASSSFYVGMKKAPKHNRMGIYALYALFRTLDDIADDLFTSDKHKTQELEIWRNKVFSIYNGSFNPHTVYQGERQPYEILKVLAPYINEFKLPKEEFAYMFDGMFFDVKLEENQLLSNYDVKKYCRQVACTAGVLVMYTLGVRTVIGKKFAVRLGYALQLINILRDIDVDVHLKRIYIAQEQLDKYFIDYNNIAQSKNFHLLHKDLIREIEEHLHVVEELIIVFRHNKDFKKIKSTIVMMNTYETIFKNIKKGKKDPKLSLFQKTKILLRMLTL